jgi:hypothetical protein
MGSTEGDDRTMSKKNEQNLAGVSEAEAVEAERDAKLRVVAAEQVLDVARAEHRLAVMRRNASRCHPSDAAASSIAGGLADAEAALEKTKARA